MLVWLIDTEGPGSHAEVTDSEAQALASAEALLSDGRAESAPVEVAHLRIGGYSMHSGYERAGLGWTAVLGDDGAVTWTQFRPLALAAS